MDYEDEDEEDPLSPPSGEIQLNEGVDDELEDEDDTDEIVSDEEQIDTVEEDEEEKPRKSLKGVSVAPSYPLPLLPSRLL
jgi:hypothetical protein